MVGTELFGKKLGLVGAGHIAGLVAEIMKKAFDCEVYCWNPHKNAEQLSELGYRKIDTLEELFHDMDMISVHVPMTESTRNLISDSAFENANPAQLLDNTSRGGIVDEIALLRALIADRVGGPPRTHSFQSLPIRTVPFCTWIIYRYAPCGWQH